MGTVIAFPTEQRGRYVGGANTTPSEPAAVIILPTVRIERQPDGTPEGLAPQSGAGGGRRRRPARRS